MPENDDFRKDRRFPHDATVFFEDLDSDANATASLRNYSRQGIYFETNERFLPGQELIIGIDQSPYTSSRKTYESYFVKVKWFKELYDADHRFGYGAKLQLPSDLEEKQLAATLTPELEKMPWGVREHAFREMSPAPMPETGDQDTEQSPGKAPSEPMSETAEQDMRRHPRKPFIKPVFFARHGQYFRGRSRDISPGGLFIETPDRFEIGQSIRLVIPQTKYDNGVMIKGKITRLESNGIGVRFTGLIKRNR